ncbi:M1 family metallopeptidase [Sphingomonas sp.]|uniref:M1 family metallopeptidase n=1 Tax=Sphingomonas sp. TaxID=28214 RepID=UPI0025E36B1E|nr:M1 family metallopeptidase [Sphingomonas sp.]
MTIGASPPPAPPKGLPPLTKQTERSGGPVDPDQAKLQFDHADLSLEVFPEKQAISGRAVLSFTARAPLDRLVLDLDRNLPVRGVAINGQTLKPGAWSNPEGRLTITLPRAAAAGEQVNARIDYAGTPHVAVNPPWDDGFVWTRTRDGKPWVATTAEGYGCDLFWPCLDFPKGEPRLVDLRITVPRGLVAPGNGVLIDTEKLSGGRSRWHWRVKQPNSYGIAINAGPYQLITAPYRSRYGNSVPMQLWHLAGNRAKAEALFAEFAPALDFMESVIGPYPFGDEKVGVVEAPHLGMEHQTINAYGNGYGKSIDGFDQIFQHELSHEWFGNQLTAADWDDYWLHEGFAQYMQPLYGRWREGEARYAAMMSAIRGRIENRAPMVSGQSRTEEEVYEIKNGGPGPDIYYKGAWVLHTLRWLIGDDAFFESTTRLVYGRPDPRPGNFQPRYATTAEFQQIVARTAGRDLGWFFDAYLRRAALPELVMTRRGGQMTLEWVAGGPFPMPVEVELDGKVNRIEMPGGRATLAVPDAAHVVLDPAARILRRSEAVERFQAWQRDPR